MQGNPRTDPIRVVAKANNLDLELVDTSSGFPDQYEKLNPLAKIPTFEGSDGYVLTETIAICIYGMLSAHTDTRETPALMRSTFIFTVIPV